MDVLGSHGRWKRTSGLKTLTDQLCNTTVRWDLARGRGGAQHVWSCHRDQVMALQLQSLPGGRLAA